MAEVLTIGQAHDRALGRWIAADRAMLALGDEVAHHPALYGIGRLPLPEAIAAICRYVGTNAHMDEPAVVIFERLTTALRGKRCQR